LVPRRKKQHSEWNELLFLFFLQCLEENVLSETSGWFIDPLEELFGIYMGVPPIPSLFLRQKKTTVNEINFSFFFFSFTTP